MARVEGVEPNLCGFGDRYSTDKLHPHGAPLVIGDHMMNVNPRGEARPELNGRSCPGNIFMGLKFGGVDENSDENSTHA